MPRESHLICWRIYFAISEKKKEKNQQACEGQELCCMLVVKAPQVWNLLKQLFVYDVKVISLFQKQKHENPKCWDFSGE